jgi:hypothetical protein
MRFHWVLSLSFSCSSARGTADAFSRGVAARYFSMMLYLISLIQFSTRRARACRAKLHHGGAKYQKNISTHYGAAYIIQAEQQQPLVIG